MNQQPTNNKYPKGLRVYIAGPISNNPYGGINVALILADELVKNGHFPYIPHLTCFWALATKEAGERTHAKWLELDMEWLRLCDVLVRLSGASVGADAEVAAAVRLGIPVISLDDLDRPLTKGQGSAAVPGGLHATLGSSGTPPHPPSYAEEAQALVHGARREAYGHPAEDFGRAAAIINAQYGTSFGALDIPFIMTSIKLSRERNCHKRDNLVDIIGYLLTEEMIRARLNPKTK